MYGFYFDVFIFILIGHFDLINNSFFINSQTPVLETLLDSIRLKFITAIYSGTKCCLQKLQ